MLKQYKVEYWVVSVLFLLLPVDMINGIMLHNNIVLPISFGQLYKIIIIFLFFISFLFKAKYFLTSMFCVFLLLIPSLFQAILQLKIGFLFSDIIKIFRYTMPIFSFMFFVKLINQENQKNINLLFKLINFSYFILVANILLKYLGLGYPSYDYSNIGSKGYFFAGNEISALLIILSAIIGYRILLNGSKKKYYLFFLFNLFVALTISSKTGMIGVFLTFLLMPLKTPSFKLNMKKIKYFLISLFAIPLLVFVFLKFLKGTLIFVRFQYFWKKLDFWTFVLSNRNTYLSKAWDTYVREYNFLEKMIGVGQTLYEKLNGNSIVEIDIADIFFAYSLIGVLMFFSMLYFIYKKAKYYKINTNNPYAGLVYLLLLILLGISTIAGHVFSSGMSAVFIGLLFSLMYLKEDQKEDA